VLQKLFTLMVLACVAVGLYIYWAVRDLPAIETILKQGVNPSRYTQVFARDGSLILSYGKFRHSKVTLSEVSPHFIDALLATEDRRFYQHYGVDPVALMRALVRDVVHRRLLEGGSTLTQQLARNVFLSNERSLRRKVREAALAIQLERRLSKEDILTLYINNIYFGEGAYGIAAASEIYFNKRPSQLSIEEAAVLAGMPQAPSAYSPFRDKETTLKRRKEVLENMVEAGRLEEEKYLKLVDAPMRLNPSGRDVANGDRPPFFNQFVLRQVREQFDLDEQTFWQSGLKVITTLDVRAQRLAARSVKEQSALWGRTQAKQQAALISLDPKTGAILAYVGGKDFGVSQFDRVSQALRSPGSLFKVFTYTTAIDRGGDPTKTYVDEPIQFGNWSPSNYDKSHRGTMTLTQALAQSNNIVAVKVLNELGPTAVIDMAHRMGLNAQLQDNLALTLGGSGVTLLDITAAFSVLDNQGARAEPYAIEAILDADGNKIYQHGPMTTAVLSRTTVDTMVAMMMEVIRVGTGRSADIGRPTAGKTGTSDDHRDAWFIGFTPDVITGVWVGNDDNTPMKGMVGGGLPSAIWKQYMRPYLSNRLATNFDLSFSKPIRGESNSIQVENPDAPVNLDSAPVVDAAPEVTDPTAPQPPDTAAEPKKAETLPGAPPPPPTEPVPTLVPLPPSTPPQRRPLPPPPTEPLGL
jgi:penicillin-binding protein 1A